MSRILVCGGRSYSNSDYMDKALTLLYSSLGFDTVIEGGARGADHLASSWVIYHSNQWLLTHIREEAQWGVYGNAAGPIRNRKMLDDHHPNFIAAFPGGPGTANMVKIAAGHVDWIFDLREEPPLKQIEAMIMAYKREGDYGIPVSADLPH